MTLSVHRFRTSLASGAAVAAAGAALTVFPLASAALAAPAPAVATIPTCDNNTTHQTAPVPHASLTYSAGAAGSVTIARGAGRGLTVTSTAPASGYDVRIVTAKGKTVKVTFFSASSNTAFTAHLGHTDTTLISIHTSVC